MEENNSFWEQNVLGNLQVANIVWDLVLLFGPILLGGFIYRVLIFYRRRSSKSIFAFSNRKPLVFVFSSVDASQFTETEFQTYTTATESVFFVANILGYLQSKLKISAKYDLQHSALIEPNRLREDLIVVGGPKYNSVTSRYFEIADPRLQFSGYSIISDFTGKNYSGRVSTEGRVTKDYAAIISDRNPWNNGARILLVCGSRAFAAIAASEFLSNGGAQRLIDGLETMYQPDKPLLAVISTEVSHFPHAQWSLSPCVVEEVHQ